MDKLLVMCVVMIELEGYFGYVQKYCQYDTHLGEHCKEFCVDSGHVQLSCGANEKINLIMGEHYGPCIKKDKVCTSCTTELEVCIDDKSPDWDWTDMEDKCQNQSVCNVTHEQIDVTYKNSNCCGDKDDNKCNGKYVTQVTTITWNCTSSLTTISQETTTAGTITNTETVQTSKVPTEQPTEYQTSDYTAKPELPTTHQDTTSTVTTFAQTIATSTADHVTIDTNTTVVTSTPSKTTRSTSSQPPVLTTEEDENGEDYSNLYVIVGAVAAGTAVVVLVVVVICCYCRKRSPPSKSTSDDVSNPEMSLSKSKIVDTDQNAGVKHYTADSGEQYAMVNKSQTPASEFGAQPDIQRVSSKPDLLPDTEVYYNTRDSVKNTTAVSNEEGVVEDYYGVSQPTDPSLIEQAQRFQAADVTMDSLDHDADMFGLNIGGGGMMDDDYDYTRHDVRVLQKARNEAQGEDNEDYAVPDVPTITTTDPLKSDSIGHMEEGDDYAYVYGHMGTNGPIIKQGGHVISGRPVIGPGAGGQEHMDSGTLSAAVHNAKGGKDVPNDYSLEAPVYALSSKTKPLTDGTETVMKENELYG